MKPGVGNFYTDGSRMYGRVGCGIFYEELNLNLSFRLPDHCSVFQAELIAINEAVDWMKYNVISVRDIGIFTDSQAAIKVLQSGFLTSKVALNCLSSLNEMAEQFNIQFTLVSGHFNITGNVRADGLARKGTSCRILLSKADTGAPLSTCKQILKEEAYNITNERWSKHNACVITRQIWPSLDLSRSNQLLSLKRCSIGTIVGVITGHCLMGNHARRLGVFSHDYCRGCRDEEEEETILHYLCTCPSLAQHRLNYLGTRILCDLTDLSRVSVRDIYCFAKSSKWVQ
jgi:ribonuclease HI